MSLPQNLFYTNSHEWVEFSDNKVRIGITDHAQQALSDIVFVNTSEVGAELAAGVVFGDVESIKAVSELYSPLSGVVSAVNQEAIDSPELLNQKPYESWIIELSGEFDKTALLSAAEYAALIEAE